MTAAGRDLRVIVLAAQRKGTVNPLAERFAVSHKCLIPLREQPLISHVVNTLVCHPGVGSIAISVEEDAFPALRQALAGIGTGARIDFVPAADNLADSVLAAAKGHNGPMIITTADNALLAHGSLDAMRDTLGRTDVAVAMAPREAVLAVHPQGQRRFYRFRGGEFSNCNLYGMAHPKALRAAETFRGGGQFARNASRIIEAFGLSNLLLLRLRLVTLAQGLRRISRRLGLEIAPVILEDGSQAIDVDNDRTYRIVDELLAARLSQQDCVLVRS